jgi:hypothetical protein
MKVRGISIIAALAMLFAVSSCGNDDDQLLLSGGAKDFVMDPAFAEFCGAYDELNTAINAMPAAGSDKESFAVVLEKSSALVDVAPEEILDSVMTNDAILNAMNAAFADRNYDQATISTDEGLRQEVQTLYAQEGLPELTTKYSEYLVKNCGVSTEGN